MHPALLDACVTMLPRLEAAEQLRAIESVAAGSGRLAADAHRALISRLVRETGTRTPAARPRDAAEHARTLAAAGIGMRRAPARTGDDLSDVERSDVSQHPSRSRDAQEGAER
jgi:hypothetical protein